MQCAAPGLGAGTHSRDSKTRPQMREYALRVAIALAGSAICVHCGDPIGLGPGQGEVDRTIPGRCYVPGLVIMVCGACNRDMADSPNVIDRRAYARDVAKASERVGAPLTTADARRVVAASRARFATLGRSRYFRG